MGLADRSALKLHVMEPENNYICDILLQIRMDMQGIAIPDIIVAKHTVYMRPSCTGMDWSATMRRIGIAAVTKKMTSFADSGEQNRTMCSHLNFHTPDNDEGQPQTGTLRLWKYAKRIRMRQYEQFYRIGIRITIYRKRQPDRIYSWTAQR